MVADLGTLEAPFPEACEAILELLGGSVAGMWTDFGRTCSVEGVCGPPEAGDDDVALASIAFAADGLRGVVTLATPATLIETAAPDVAVIDAVGEQSNMVLGRLKNRLLEYGVALRVGLPSTAVARTVRWSPSLMDARSRWLRFAIGGDALFVRMDVCCEADFVLAENVPVDRQAVGDEGELLLFGSDGDGCPPHGGTGGW